MAQEVRLYNIGKWLKQRYQRIWNNLLVERRNINRKRAFVISLLECIPEIVVSVLSMEIALDIVYGKATLGDYTLYTGLISQLLNAVYKISSSTMDIYSNRLKIDNMKSLDQFKNTVMDQGKLKLVEVDSITFENVSFAYFSELANYSSKHYDANLMKLFDPDGIELSGGQFQKLALARVFYRRHTALILDEPSSNLDPMAERKIFDTLQVIASDKMTIFTSHHLSTIYLANRIIVLEKGKVVEDGKHMDLLKNNKRYAELFRYKQEQYFSTYFDVV